MASYKVLVAQAEELMRQGEAARKAEIKAKVAAYGITLADMGGNPNPMASCTRDQGLKRTTTYCVAVPPAPTLASTSKCTPPPFTLTMSKGPTPPCAA